MNKETYLKVSGIIFSVVTILHVLRLVLNWEVVLGGWQVPIWASFLGIAVGGFLAYSAFKLSK